MTTAIRDIPGTHTHFATLDPVAAADATEEQAIFVAPFKCRLNAVRVTGDAAVTGDNTNRKNLNVINKGSAGAGSTELANLDLTTGVNLVAFDEKNIATGLTTELAEGDVLSLQVEKVGTGVAIPRAVLKVEFEPSPSGA